MSGPSSSGKTRRGRRKREPGDGVLFMVLRPLFLPHTNAHPPHTCLPLLSALSAHTHRYRTLTWPFRKAYLRTADEAAAGVTYALVSRDLQNAGGRLVSDGRVIEMSSKGSDPKYHPSQRPGSSTTPPNAQVHSCSLDCKNGRDRIGAGE